MRNKIHILLFYFFYHINSYNGFLLSKINNRILSIKSYNKNPFGKKYYDQYLNPNKSDEINNKIFIKKYPLTRPDFLNKIRQLNSKNETLQNDAILGNFNETTSSEGQENDFSSDENTPTLRIYLNKSNLLKSLGLEFENEEDEQKVNGFFDEDEDTGRRRYRESSEKKSKNFEVIKNYNILFKDVGGYENVKKELEQLVFKKNASPLCVLV